MYKKIMAGIALTAALTAIGAAAVSADGALKVNTRGIAFEIPEELSGLVTVDENDPDQNTIVSVYETASVEAAKAQGREDSGAGWIFSITAIPEARMRELRCGGMDGMSVFAEDEDLYYVYETPTDVRFVREQYEDIEEDQKQFTALNEWAGQEVRQEILANNPELDPEFFTNTELDMYLAQAAYKPGTNFVLKSLDLGPDPLDPSQLMEDDYLDELAEEAIYFNVTDEMTAPDGEYNVLSFNDGEVRFEFFKTTDPEEKNLIREVRTVDGEEYTTLYLARFEDPEDTATDIMERWVQLIANGGSEYDDDDDD